MRKCGETFIANFSLFSAKKSSTLPPPFLVCFATLRLCASALNHCGTTTNTTLKAPNSSPPPILRQPRELLDEFKFSQPLERRQPRHLPIRQPHLPRPSTTSRATLTFMKNRRSETLPNPPQNANPTPQKMRLSNSPNWSRCPALHSHLYR
ncbi:MAG: hypothetical protein JWR26_3342 [Pedosphaera sp.]|nr:hypothetical protein [Pedosphaera sp.]